MGGALTPSPNGPLLVTPLPMRLGPEKKGINIINKSEWPSSTIKSESTAGVVH